MHSLITVILHPKGNFSKSLPRSDTLFGALCWSIRIIHSNTLLESILFNFANSSPPFLISSCFPCFNTDEDTIYFLPAPKWTLTKTFSNLKEFKKISWIEASIFQDFIDGKLTPDEIATSLSTLNNQKFYSNNGFLLPQNLRLKIFPSIVSLPHNSVNRLSNSPSEGMFFHSTEFSLPPYQNWSTYFMIKILDPKTLKILTPAIDYLGVMGLGGDSSVGKGQFSPMFIQSVPVHDSHNPNSWITLSLYLPKNQEWQLIRNHPSKSLPAYSVTQRKGYIESAFIPGGKIWKKTVPVFEEGSIFPPLNLDTPGNFPIVKDVYDPTHPSSKYNAYYFGYAYTLNIKIGGI